MCALCDTMTDRRKASLDPALSELLAGLARRGLLAGDPLTMPIAEARLQNEAYFRAIAEPRSAVAHISIVEATSPDGHAVPVKVAIPEGAKADTPALLYCHGGGYAFADIHTHDHLIRALAVLSGMRVFAVDYRRTPEVSFPVPLEDALTALAAMRGREWIARFGHDPARIVVLGDSAGAHLGLGLMLALRQRGLPQLQGAALAYGMYARRFDTWSHHAYGDTGIGLSSAKMRWFWDQLLPPGLHPDPAHADPFLMEPLEAELAGLPPLALIAAECDCLLDDTLDFRETCKRQDHPHSFDLFRGASHGFLHLTSVYPGAREALALMTARLKAMV
ncbi:MAG: alpha/beta hydrolase [Beijerinckiaceae bacterium]